MKLSELSMPSVGELRLLRSGRALEFPGLATRAANVDIV